MVRPYVFSRYSMTRTQNALRAGAATLLAGSLIFTSFQTFAQDFDWSDWGSVGSETVSDGILEEPQAPSVSIIADATTEITGGSTWTDIVAIDDVASDHPEVSTETPASTESETSTPITNEMVTDNSAWMQENSQSSVDQAYSCPCGDKLLDTNGRYAGYCSYQSGDDRVVFHYTDKSKCPLDTQQVCHSMIAGIHQWYSSELEAIYLDLIQCERDSNKPCRGTDCPSDTYPPGYLCQVSYNRKVDSLSKELGNRYDGLPSFCLIQQ